MRNALNDVSAFSGDCIEAIATQATGGMPLVSIITAVFNGRGCIADCIESVLNQDYLNIEHIILDGGSTDGTVEILRKYQGQLRYWKSEPDNGVYDAWNKGLLIARGEWIAFLGSDDKYLPSAVSTYMDIARRNPHAQFLSSKARLNHSTGYSPVFGGPWEWPRFATAMSTIHVGTMHHRSLFQNFGQFDTSYRIAGDYEFMLRPRDRLQAAHTSAVTVVMGAGGLSDSIASYREARRAKISTKVRRPFLATIDLWRAVLRFHLRRLFLSIRFRVLRALNNYLDKTRSYS